MLFIMALLACGDAPKSDVEPQRTEATLQILSVTSGGAISGVAISSLDSYAYTDADGKASVDVIADETYSLVASQQGSMNHSYQGIAASNPFEVVGFLVNRSITTSVFSSLGISQSEQNGIVVAALDEIDLSPAVGASAILEANANDNAFIFGSGGTPQSGNEIETNGSSFVFFPNVEPGAFTLTAQGANGTSCRSVPAGESNFLVTVEADTVSVVVFSCE